MYIVIKVLNDLKQETVRLFNDYLKRLFSFSLFLLFKLEHTLVKKKTTKPPLDF